MKTTNSRWANGVMLCLLAIGLTNCDSNPAVENGDELNLEMSQAATSASKLLYSPPATSCTYYVPDTGVNKKLSNSCSWKVVLPSTPIENEVRIRGGKDIVIIGGAFERQPTVGGNATLSFYDEGNTQTRTIHVEGVSLDLSDYASDGIVFDAPKAHIHLQNIRITGVHGTHAGTHGDAVQNWGGAKSVKVHKMTVRTSYQGLNFNGNVSDEIGEIRLKEVEFKTASGHSGNPIFLMLTKTWSACTFSPNGVTLTDVSAVANPGYGNSIGDKEVYPSKTAPDVQCRALEAGNGTITWYGGVISGSVQRVTDISNIVPSTTAGLNYVSPGYL